MAPRSVPRAVADLWDVPFNPPPSFPSPLHLSLSPIPLVHHYVRRCSGVPAAWFVQHQTVLMFDRATLFYDLKGHRQTYMRPPYMDPNDRNVSMAVAKANINLPKHLNREAWGLRDGIVISRPVRTTYAAVAFPAKDPKQHPLSGQTHVAVVNRALQIILSSPGGFFM